MLKARKRNRVVRIADEKADEYKTLGYQITDMDGNVLYEPEDKDREIAELKKKIAGLEEKLREAERKAADLERQSAESEQKPEETPETNPKVRKSKGKSE